MWNELTRPPVAWHDACHANHSNTVTTKSQREKAKIANKAHHSTIATIVAHHPHHITKIPQIKPNRYSTANHQCIQRIRRKVCSPAVHPCTLWLRIAGISQGERPRVLEFGWVANGLRNRANPACGKMLAWNLPPAGFAPSRASLRVRRPSATLRSGTRSSGYALVAFPLSPLRSGPPQPRLRRGAGSARSCAGSRAVRGKYAGISDLPTSVDRRKSPKTGVRPPGGRLLPPWGDQEGRRRSREAGGQVL